jgi:hypothetical protein
MKTNECTNLITIPEGTEAIGMSAFADCTNLKEVKLPSTLREIGLYAFAGSGIEHLVIPEGVEKIGGCAFEDCKNLKEVKLPSTLEEIGLYAFEGCENIEIQKKEW